MNCKYQSRYLIHQTNKRESLVAKSLELFKDEKFDFDDVIKSRRSVRKFIDRKIKAKQIKEVLNYAKYSPSSCNRQAVCLKIVKKKYDKNLVGELLVGGKGWINKAGFIILLFADMKAYKSPNEVLFMPFLDAGVIGMTLSLGAEKLGYGACIVNPNVRAEDTNQFNNNFNDKGLKFCMAVAVGYQGIELPKRENVLNICK